MTDTAILGWASHHYILILSWWVLLAINSMPTPTEKSRAAYRWLFDILHVVFAGPMRIAKIRKAATKLFFALIGNGDQD